MNPDVFLAYDIRGKVGTDLTPEFAENVGRAFSDYLPQNGPVAVGYDMRPDSKELAEAMMRGLVRQGREVWSIGRVASDMIYFATGHYKLAGGAVITASHNPGEYNGIKFCREDAGGVGLDSGLDIIRDAMVADEYLNERTGGKIIEKDVMNDWIEHVLGFIDIDDLKKYKIAVDAGNGMAGAVMPVLQTKLPLEFIELYYELDGTFPNHEANPLKEETLDDLKKTILENKLDLGIAFDGDGDRAVLVDEKGQVLSGSVLLTILAKSFLAKNPSSTILYNAICSNIVPETIKAKGGKAIRTRVGHSIIKAKMKEYKSLLAGEHSGHYYFKDNFNADSGLIAAIAAIDVLNRSDKTLSELADEYRVYENIPETNFHVEDKDAAMKRIAKKFETESKIDWLDGVTVRLKNGAWFNIRPSNTEPLLRLNVEAKDEKTLSGLVAIVEKLIQR